MRFGCVATAVFVITLHGALAQAACNSIPQPMVTMSGAAVNAVAPTPTATPATYNGRIGAIDQPFVAPGNWVTVRRRPCDQSQNQGSDIASGENPNVVLILHPIRKWAGDHYDDPASEAPKIAFIQSDAANCPPKQVASCDDALNGHNDGDAKCIRIPASEYVVTTDGVRFRMPDLSVRFPAFNSGSLGVFVTQGNAPVPCADMVRHTCLDALPTNVLPSKIWHACVDALYEDKNAQCKTNKRDRDFRHLTLLPAWNAADEECFNEDQLCADTAEELRFVPDADNNLLFPMDWTSFIEKCNKPCRYPIRGDMVPPGARFLQLPSNDPQKPDKNRSLQSFTPDGFPLDPKAFKREEPAFGVAVSGTTDGPYSVLRMKPATKLCKDPSGTPQPSETPSACDDDNPCGGGKTCQMVCVGGANDGAKCANDSECPKAKCGAGQDLDQQFDGTRWRLVRDDSHFIQNDPTPNATCSALPTGMRCVGYQMTVHQPENVPTDTPTLTPTPMPTAPPRPPPPPDANAVSGGVPGKAIASDPNQSDQWTAVFVYPPPGGGPLSIQVTQTHGCTTASCKQTIQLGTQEPVGPTDEDSLRFVGSQLRILVKDAGSAKPTATFMLYDVARPAAQTHEASGARSIVVVGPVDLSDREQYDPLVQYPSGSTLFVRTGLGYCRRNYDQKILPVPSICNPDASTCPPGSTCRKSPVVMAMDLVTDADHNGVPDSLQAGIR